MRKNASQQRRRAWRGRLCARRGSQGRSEGASTCSEQERGCMGEERSRRSRRRQLGRTGERKRASPAIPEVRPCFLFPLPLLHIHYSLLSDCPFWPIRSLCDVYSICRLRDDALARWVVQASRAEPEMSCGERDVHRGGREQDGGCSGEGEGSAGQSQRAEKPRGGDGAGPGAGAGAGAGAGLAAASGAGGGHLHAQRQRELLEPLLPGWPPELFLLHHKPPAD